METETEKVNLTNKDIKSIAKKVKFENDLEEFEYEEELETADIDIEEELSHADKVQNFDIFAEVINPQIENGTPVSWTLRRDNKVVASGRQDTFSWALVQKNYGGGRFQVRSRNEIDNVWSKSQSLILEELKDESQSQNNINQMDVATIMKFNQETQEADRVERRREREEALELQQKREDIFNEKLKENNSGGSTMELLALMMKQSREDQQRNDTLRREEDEKRRQETIRLDDIRREDKKEEEKQRREEKKEEEKQRRQDKIDSEARMETLLATIANKKDDGVSFIDHMEKIEDAKVKARKEAKAEIKDIEERAEKRALELSEAKGDGDKSITDKAVESVLSSLPHIAQAFSGKKPAPAQRRIKRKRIPTKTILNQNPIVNSDYSLNSEENTQTDNTQVDSSTQTIETSVETPVETTSLENNTNETQNLADSQKELMLKDTINDILSPVILASLVAEEGYLPCFTKSSEQLTNSGVDIRLVNRLYSKEDMLDLFEGMLEIARSSNKETELLTWIDGYYGEFEKSE